MTSKTSKTITTGGSLTDETRGSEYGHVVETADAAELVRLEAGAADGLRILYGGSVKAANVAGIMQQADVDGCLVGGASLMADEFGGICRFYDMPVL